MIIAPFPIAPQFSPKIVPAVARFRYKKAYPVDFARAFRSTLAMRTRKREKSRRRRTK